MAEDKKTTDSALLTQIYREVGETKTAVKSVDSKIDNHIEYSLHEFAKINELDSEQNRILDKHIEGVNTLREMHVAHRNETKQQIEILKESLELQKDECNERLQTLEKPYDLLKLIGKVAVWMGGILGVIYVALKIAVMLGVL